MSNKSSGILSQVPPGSGNIWGFSFFNAVSFQIILGAPMILYAASLGASTTVLGIIAAMTPILTVLQIPAAYHLERVGYRRFVLLGWGLRSIFILIIALTPLMVFLDAFSQLAILLAAMFAFNLLRGISTAAWFPWISSLIAEQVRGRFFSRNHIFVELGSLSSLLLAALILRGDPGRIQFFLAFFVSTAAAWCSLLSLRRIPETDTMEAMKTSGQPVPWRAILSYPPFLALMIFNLMVTLALGALPVFTVTFLREAEDFSTSLILLLTCMGFLGSIAIALTAGGLLDRFGSKPFLRAAMALLLLAIAGWWALAVGLIPLGVSASALFFLMTGLGTTLFALANLRLMLGTMPPMGKNHFFAYFTVISSLGLGASPFIWGVILDWIGSGTYPLLGLSVGRFAVYFAGTWFLGLAALLFVGRLTERIPAPLPVGELTLAAKLRRLMQLWNR